MEVVGVAGVGKRTRRGGLTETWASSPGRHLLSFRLERWGAVCQVAAGGRKDILGSRTLPASKARSV